MASDSPLATALASAQNAAQAIKLAMPDDAATTVKYVASSPELDRKTDYLEAWHNPKPLDKKSEHQILAMIEDIRKEIPASGIGGEVKVAAKTKLFVTDSNSKFPQMDSYTVHGDDGAAFSLVTITAPALALLKTDPAAFKFALAHEQSHHLFEMNPGLSDNPKLAATSPEYKLETSRIDYGAAYYTLQKQAQMVERSRSEHMAEGKPFTADDESRIMEMAEQRKVEFNLREKAGYDEELKADRLGLLLTRNRGAAERLIGTLEGAGTTITEEARLKEAQAIAASSDVHPSQHVRSAELREAEASLPLRAKNELPPLAHNVEIPVIDKSRQR